MNKIFTRIISAMAAALMLFSLSSCKDKYKVPESTAEELQTVFVIGDYEVPFELYRYFFMNYKDQYYADGTFDSSDSDAVNETFLKIDSMVRESLLRIYATFALSLDYGIDYTGGSVQKAVTQTFNDSIKNDFGGVDAFIESLGPAHLNASVYRLILAEFECESRLSSVLREKGVINEDKEKIMEEITGGAFCHAKQILIMNDPDDDPEENKKLADDILIKAQLGIDFDELVAEYGEDMQMVTSPVGYYFPRGQLIEEFENAAFDLEVGEISEVIESRIGYHIIQRCEIDPSYVVANFDYLSESYLASCFYLAVSEKVATMSVSDTDFSRSLSMSDFTK